MVVLSVFLLQPRGYTAVIGKYAWYILVLDAIYTTDKAQQAAFTQLVNIFSFLAEALSSSYFSMICLTTFILCLNCGEELVVKNTVE